MVWQAVEDELRDQFYSWELWGRGWVDWPEPVHLEPPFRPFFGHFIRARPQVDDGRHHTTLSRIAAWFRGESSSQATTELARVDEEITREAFVVQEERELHSFILHVPRDRVIRPDSTSAFLATLRAARSPIAFEVVGAKGKIAMQFGVRADDEQLFLSTLRNHFPDVTAVPGDLLTEAFSHGDFGVFGVFEIALRREFMLPLATFRNFDPDPLIALVAALEDTEGDSGAVQILFEGPRTDQDGTRSRILFVSGRSLSRWRKLRNHSKDLRHSPANIPYVTVRP